MNVEVDIEVGDIIYFRNGFQPDVTIIYYITKKENNSITFFRYYGLKKTSHRYSLNNFQQLLNEQVKNFKIRKKKV